MSSSPYTFPCLPEESPLRSIRPLLEPRPSSGSRTQASTLADSDESSNMQLESLSPTPQVARGTPEEEDEAILMAQCHVVNMTRSSQLAGKYADLLQRLAETHRALTKTKQEYAVADKERRDAQHKCEKAEAEAEGCIIDDLIAVKVVLQAKIAEMNTVYDKGFCIVSVPSESGPPSKYLLVDNRFREIFREIRSQGRRYQGVGLADPTVSAADLKMVPKNLRRSQFGVHGLRIGLTAFIPFTEYGCGILISHRDRIELSDAITEAFEHEMFTCNSQGVGMVYYGTFIRRDGSYAFNDLVTGHLPELFVDEIASRDGDNDASTKLQLQWSNRENDLRFCVLEFKEFKKDYLAKLDKFFAKSAREYLKQPTKTHPTTRRASGRLSTRK